MRSTVSTCALLFFAVNPSPAATLVALDEYGRLYNVNVDTAQVYNVRDIGIRNMAGIEFLPDGRLLGLTSFYQTPENALVSISKGGSVSIIGDTGLLHVVEGGMAFDVSSGKLVGAQEQTAPLEPDRILFEINVVTGQASEIASPMTGFADFSALTFDHTGRLFALDTANETLVELNPTTAAILQTIQLDATFSAAAGMAFDFASSHLLIAGSTPNETLFRFDTNSNTMTTIGDIDTFADARIVGLAMMVPEPTTGAMIFAGLAFFMRRRPR